MRAAPLASLLACALLACDGATDPAPPPGSQVAYTQDRAPCADRNPYRNAYFGDLHAHTGLSWDAWAYGNHATPADAWAFAKGGLQLLPGGDGDAPRIARMERPLDFAALTDHAEFLGEVRRCLTESSPAWDTPTCQDYRVAGEPAVVAFGVRLAAPEPRRVAEVCDPVPGDCQQSAREVWREIADAAEAADDRTAACRFTAFPGYEYTYSPNITNLHRNIVFRNGRLPDVPVTAFEAPDSFELYRALRDQCLDAGTGCDVVSIAHNSNWSNGLLFDPAYPVVPPEDERSLASLRARVEPLGEVFQHKGDMECDFTLADPGGDPDPLCDWEKQRFQPFDECGDEPGSGGVSRLGCVSRLDFLRNVLKKGLQEQARLGANPFALGMIGSTDGHNSTPGYVDETRFEGHVGTTDNTPDKRLGEGNLTHHGVVYNPGGLAGAWSVENSRDALFEAFRRKEVFATSGPRIRVRLFGGFGTDPQACAAPEDDRLVSGYRDGVPMGAALAAPPAGTPGTPVFAAWAESDPGTTETPGAPLQRLQLVKGWLGPDGEAREKVVDLAVAGMDASVSLATCQRTGEGAATLCGTFRDEDFDPARPAFWYVRAVEVPTCRWSVRQCNALPADVRPATCQDPAFYRPIQERAWSSPVFWNGDGA